MRLPDPEIALSAHSPQTRGQVRVQEHGRSGGPSGNPSVHISGAPASPRLIGMLYLFAESRESGRMKEQFSLLTKCECELIVS